MDNPKDFDVSDVVWDIGCLYAGFSDPKISEDMDKSKATAIGIAGRYAGRVAQLSADGLYEAVKEIEGLAVSLGRLETFAQLAFATRVDDPETGAFLQKVMEFLSLVSRELVFFDIEWANVADEKAGMLLNSSVLNDYRHYLESIRRYRPHMLSENE